MYDIKTRLMAAIMVGLILAASFAEDIVGESLGVFSSGDIGFF